MSCVTKILRDNRGLPKDVRPMGSPFIILYRNYDGLDGDVLQERIDESILERANGAGHGKADYIVVGGHGFTSEDRDCEFPVQAYRRRHK